jgi:hypothetical protein
VREISAFSGSAHPTLAGAMQWIHDGESASSLFDA